MFIAPTCRGEKNDKEVTSQETCLQRIDIAFAY